MVNSSHKVKSKVRIKFFEVKRNKIMRLMQLQVKMQKITEITYLESNRRQTRHRLTHLETSK